MRDQKGQTLLFLIVAMTVALAIGTNISLRTLSSVSRVTRTDTSEMIRAAAEGGAERFLSLSEPALDDLQNYFNGGVLPSGITDADDLCKKAGADIALDTSSNLCLVKFSSGDTESHSLVKVDESKYNYQTPMGVPGYKFSLEQDGITEIFLISSSSSGNLTLCYKPENKSNIYYIMYGSSGILSKGGINGDVVSGTDISGFTPALSSSAFDKSFTYCNNLTIPAETKGMRIRPIGSNTDIGIFSDSLDSQGHLITSSAVLTQKGQNPVYKTVKVRKSYPYLPAIFDFGIFSLTGGL